jgi:hypothetical protein
MKHEITMERSLHSSRSAPAAAAPRTANNLQWNRSAWKTDAFYSNPLKGFTPVP